MYKVLNEIKGKYCSVCHVGPPSKLIGYKSSGTCLDYIYDNFKVPYSLAWEIYSSEEPFVELKSFLYKGKKINTQGNPHSRRIKQIVKNLQSTSFFSTNEKEELINSSSSKINLRKNTLLGLSYNKTSIKKLPKTYSIEENEICVSLFNPMSRLSYEFIITNWTKALIHLLHFVKIN